MAMQRQGAVRKAKAQAQPVRIVRPARRRITRPGKSAELNVSLRTKCMMLLTVAVVLAGFFVYRSGVAASEAYALNQLKNDTQRLEAENARLHLDIAYLKSPERIQEIASGRLGMIMPDKFFFSGKK